MAEITRLLSAVEQGDPAAAAQLMPLVYEELRRQAAMHIAREKPGQTLSPTALVHEAYLRLVSTSDAARWRGRSHFYAAAAEAMRRILVDAARRKGALRHGGGLARQPLPADVPAAPTGLAPIDLLALDEALARLERHAPRKAELVKLRYFAGCTIPEAAALLGISPSTAEDDWNYSKAWLRREMRRGEQVDE